MDTTATLARESKSSWLTAAFRHFVVLTLLTCFVASWTFEALGLPLMLLLLFNMSVAAMLPSIGGFRKWKLLHLHLVRPLGLYFMAYGWFRLFTQIYPQPPKVTLLSLQSSLMMPFLAIFLGALASLLAGAFLEIKNEENDLQEATWQSLAEEQDAPPVFSVEEPLLLENPIPQQVVVSEKAEPVPQTFFRAEASQSAAFVGELDFSGTFRQAVDSLRTEKENAATDSGSQLSAVKKSVDAVSLAEESEIKEAEIDEESEVKEAEIVEEKPLFGEVVVLEVSEEKATEQPSEEVSSAKEVALLEEAGEENSQPLGYVSEPEDGPSSPYATPALELEGPKEVSVKLLIANNPTPSENKPVKELWLPQEQDGQTFPELVAPGSKELEMLFVAMAPEEYTPAEVLCILSEPQKGKKTEKAEEADGAEEPQQPPVEVKEALTSDPNEYANNTDESDAFFVLPLLDQKKVIRATDTQDAKEVFSLLSSPNNQHVLLSPAKNSVLPYNQIHERDTFDMVQTLRVREAPKDIVFHSSDGLEQMKTLKELQPLPYPAKEKA
ncbi:MAG: hypothetical protein H6727_18895 [Myxococcales bacterium]|nr:hypothetical protein [Myxococcales bacterium]